jgi:hypothetical protein
MRHLYPLIPANAGTQMVRRQRQPNEARVDLADMRSPMIWVPAFAGMSGRFEL